MNRRELLQKSVQSSLALLAGSVVRPPVGWALARPGGSPDTSETIFSRLNSWGVSELASSQTGPWTAVKAGDRFQGYQVISVPGRNSSRPWIVLEKDAPREGEFVYVEPIGIVCRIRKAFGQVGRQVAPPVEAHSREYWDTLLNAQDDILGKKYLADPRDPSLERSRRAYPPLNDPESYVGMKEYPHEVQVCWDGSIGVDKGFLTGNEPDKSIQGVQLAAALPFALNGEEIQHSESLGVLRGQLQHYLPMIQYVYQRDAEQVGYEQLILMGRVGSRPGLFLRFRLANYSATTRTVRFAVHPPMDGKLELRPDGNTIHITAPAAFRQDGTPDPASISGDMISQTRFENQNNLPVWNFQLQAGEHRDLYFVLPGYHQPERLQLKPQQIHDGFFEALLGEQGVWQKFFRRGAQFQIPEPMVNDIAKGALAKCMVSVDGNEVRGGAVWYEGFWPFCVIYLSQVLLELGYYEEVQRYVQYFIETHIEASGKFNTERPHDSNFQVFDLGDFLKLLANYYWYTQDPDLITRNKQTIDRVVGYIQRARRKSMETFPPDDPRYGMVEGVLNNDYGHKGPGYFYTNDAPLWEGLRDYSDALLEISAFYRPDEYRAEGRRLRRYARQYHATLRKSFRTAIERKDGKISFIHIHPILDNPKRPVMCTFRTNTRNRAYRRFHDWPRLVGTDFLTDEERRFIFDYEFNHEQTVLGVRRFLPPILDNFQCYSSSFQKLRLGMIRKYLMMHYGNIQALVAPGMWSGFEQAQVVPADGEKGRETGSRKYLKGPRIYGYEGAHMTWPIVRLTRQIFTFDEPSGGAVWVGRGIPLHWLTSSGPVGAEGLPTRYGKIDVRFKYRATARSLQVEINPLEKRMIPQLRVGARDPEHGRIHSVTCSLPGIRCDVHNKQELIVVHRVNRPVTLQIKFAGRQ